MKYIKIPEILSYTKGPKPVRHSQGRPCKVPTHGKTWEQKCLDELLETERNMKRQTPTLVKTYKRKVKKVRKEIVFACVRPGFTSYHRVRYYD